MQKIDYSERAVIDLNDTYNYIYYDLVNPIAASRFRSQIPKSISRLEIFPFMGKRFQNTNLRFIYFKNYLIFYNVENQKVKIQRILYKKQSFKNKFNK